MAAGKEDSASCGTRRFGCWPASVVAILLASPLLSPQFILWPTPFLAVHLSRSVRGTAVLVSFLNFIYMLGWNPDFEGNLWWVWVINMRNVALVALGGLAA